ncbi:IclR family transcriptional regulator [Streptomyces sp. NBC_01446]|uniref:IclR family transcriptional regulator n=1 Tax=Streptomyces sp. NBC_01446 TaxID=2903870 RepID=UPI00225642A4|nr:IclR family transcriptional regulator [Streptomyces sp. NBC_01446]MCX4648515.1 IclR family transcriptional regulator [Streptomyces sp. NBC_01446]
MGKQVNSRSQMQDSTAPAAAPPAPGPVDKAMEVLSALSETGAPHRLADLARHTGLAKPTVHRLLRTLAAQGFAEPAEQGSYRAGPRLLGLAARVLADDAALGLARPALAELRTRTGLFASYAVRDDRTLVHLEVLAPAQGLGLDLRPGSREPLTAGGAGLALLAALPPDEAERLLAGTDSLHADETPHVHEAISAALAETARRGYGFDSADVWRDRRTLAAAVRDSAGLPVGTLALTGLAFTLDEAAAELYGPMVRAAAGAVSAGLAARTGTRLGVVASGGEAR